MHTNSVKGPDIYVIYMPPLTVKHEHQQFTIRSGVLTGTSSRRQRGAISSRALPERTLDPQSAARQTQLCPNKPQLIGPTMAFTGALKMEDRKMQDQIILLTFFMIFCTKFIWLMRLHLLLNTYGVKFLLTFWRQFVISYIIAAKFIKADTYSKSIEHLTPRNCCSKRHTYIHTSLFAQS